MPTSIASVPASIPRRLSAFVLDAAVTFVAIAATQGLLYSINPARQHTTPNVLHAWVFGTVTLPLWLYFAWCDHRPRGAAPVAAWLGIRVVPRDERPLDWPRALQRNAVKLLPFELNHIALFHSQTTPEGSALAITCGVLMWVVVLVSWWLAWRSRERRALHDRVANTVVLYERRMQPS